MVNLLTKIKDYLYITAPHKVPNIIYVVIHVVAICIVMYTEKRSINRD